MPDLDRDAYLEELRAALLRWHGFISYEDWCGIIFEQIGYYAVLRWAPTFCPVCYENRTGKWFEFLNGGSCGHRTFARVGFAGPYPLLPEERRQLLEIIASWEED